MAFKTSVEWHSGEVGAIYPAVEKLAFDTAKNRLCSLYDYRCGTSRGRAFQREQTRLTARHGVYYVLCWVRGTRTHSYT